jgi:peroxiredoxin
MDSPFSNKVYADQLGVTFPLLSDWGGAVTRQYGLYVEDYGAPRRVTYLIDEEGRIKLIQRDRDAIDPAPVIEAALSED